MEISPQGLYELARRLFPITRSITGPGVRETHDILRDVIPELTSHEVPTGTRCFDWVVPDEWALKEGYIARLDGTRVVDAQNCNLHIVGYSTPIDQEMDRAELMAHIHTRKDMPEAIPYVTSYFRRDWGFCLSENQAQGLTDDRYRVVIRSTLGPGALTYGEIFVPGESEEEILLSTYTCHPSMGNNEVSGMVVGAFLARSILDMPRRRYSYRIVFVPETIGAVVYISRHLEQLRRNVKAGFVLTCVGDDRAWTLMPSRRPGTLPERVARHVLEQILKVPYKACSFARHRGSDERQYCSPHVDLPVVSIMRTRYGDYPEYHTSLDNLDVISPQGLWGGYQANLMALKVLEANETLAATMPCEPWLFPRGLRPAAEAGVRMEDWYMLFSSVLAHADGETDLLYVAEQMDCSILDLAKLAETAKQNGLVRPVTA